MSIVFLILLIQEVEGLAQGWKVLLVLCLDVRSRNSTRIIVASTSGAVDSSNTLVLIDNSGANVTEKRLTRILIDLWDCESS